MTPPHVIVGTGSRHARDKSLITGALTVLWHQHPDAALYAGDATGADDLLGISWAELCHLTIDEAIAAGRIRVFLADWDTCAPGCPPGHRKPSPRGGTYCPLAGPRRNDTMCAAAAAAGCPVTTLAVYKRGARNAGTADCVSAMRRHHLPAPVILAESRDS